MNIVLHAHQPFLKLALDGKILANLNDSTFINSLDMVNFVFAFMKQLQTVNFNGSETDLVKFWNNFVYEFYK